MHMGYNFFLKPKLQENTRLSNAFSQESCTAIFCQAFIKGTSGFVVVQMVYLKFMEQLWCLFLDVHFYLLIGMILKLSNLKL